MIESYCRPVLQRKLFNPLALWIHHAKWITPNGLTYSAGILGLLSAVFIAIGFKWLAVLLLLLSGLADILDGTLARLTQHSSAFGCALDIVMDRLVEASVFIGLFLLAPDGRALLTLLMMTTTLLCVTSFLVVGIFSQQDSKGKGFHYSPGLIERAEAFGFFILMILIPSWFIWLASLYCVLVLLTTIIRLKQFQQYQGLSHATTSL